jgi:hypothetical protein
MHLLIPDAVKYCGEFSSALRRVQQHAPVPVGLASLVLALLTPSLPSFLLCVILLCVLLVYFVQSDIITYSQRAHSPFSQRTRDHSSSITCLIF